MLDVFLNVILPVFLVAVIAAAFQRWRKVPTAPLNQVQLYILMPALIFTSLVGQDVGLTASGRVVGAMLLFTVLAIAVGMAVSRLLRHDRAMQSAFLLATAFPNSGNMALPLLLLAFGEPGLAIGLVVFLPQVTVGQSLGILVAARSQMHGLEPLKQVLRLPALYAIVAALVVRLFNIELPTLIAEPVGMLSRASIPMMLVALGLQLAVGLKMDQVPSLAAAVAVRLVVSAPLGYLATLALGLRGVEQAVVIIVTAMPTAVFTTIVAAEFKANPKFVSETVIVSTLLSAGTLTFVIWAVKGLVG